MESCVKNKQLYIDKEALSSLALIQEGLLYPIKSLSNKQATQDIDNHFALPFLNPAGKRNQEVLKSTKDGEILDIVVEGNVVGQINAKEVFKVDRKDRAKKISSNQPHLFDRIYSRLGDYAIFGDYEIEFSDIKLAKLSIQEKIQNYNAKKITAIILENQIFHRAYEQLIRDELERSDLVVVFLLKPYNNDLLDYELREKCLDFALKNFLINDRVCVIPLDDTYLFLGQNKILLHAIVAKNYGCTSFVIEQNTPNLSLFYDKTTPCSILNELKDIEVKIKPNYVYCNICKTLVNNTSCPHGNHHHIAYTESILEFYQLGLLPPSLLVRPEISAIILSHLYPNRFKNLQKLYYDLVPLDDGILTHKTDKDFYIELMRLYRS